eukprot:TRINITY_DN4256_c0_g1_i1.p1 TRINITY_DN4256_c0_g1~~TRINITY_DN4256_c0_g1_i1.p1  ORF type:complete len:417 (+),score=99.66 TRINITY_DN4256_c0_g1_i1:98-1348(+)
MEDQDGVRFDSAHNPFVVGQIPETGMTSPTAQQNVQNTDMEENFNVLNQMEAETTAPPSENAAAGSQEGGSDEEDFSDEEDVQIVLDADKVAEGSAGATFSRKKFFSPTASNSATATPNRGAAFGFNKPPQPTGGQTNVPGASAANNLQMLIGYPALPGGAKTILELDIDLLEDKAWRKPGADITDYFNYGFMEDTWKAYSQKQVQFRLEQSMQGKIKVFQSDQNQKAELPSELQAIVGSNTGNRTRKPPPPKYPGSMTIPVPDFDDYSVPHSAPYMGNRRPREQDDSVIQVLASGDGQDMSSEYGVPVSGGGGGSGGYGNDYDRHSSARRDERPPSGYRDRPSYPDERRREERDPRSYEDSRRRDDRDHRDSDRDRDRDRERSSTRDDRDSSYRRSSSSSSSSRREEEDRKRKRT